MATTGTQTLVNTVFEQWHATNVPTMPSDEAWEIFSAWLLFKENDLTLDIIKDGIVDGPNDGGIDAAYTLLEGSIVDLDSAIVENSQTAHLYPDGLKLGLHIIQAKNNDSFPQAGVSRLQSVLPSALDIGSSLDDLTDELSDRVRERLTIFRQSLSHLLVRRPQLLITVSIVSHGLTENIDKNVTSRADRLNAQLSALYPNARVQVDFVGSDELWKMYDSRSPETLELHCDEILTSGDSYVALTPLMNYISLICEHDRAVRRHLFDANVRDYEGQVAVNKEMLATLNDRDSPEFWWLNNGVTILCNDAHSVGKRFALSNIQIVNGLQTSHTIARWFERYHEDFSPEEWNRLTNRKILVRIIVTDDNVVRDSIIRATNRQTPVPDASLRATDKIQRLIEQYFESHGLYYDRRKGYYKNIGKDAGRIVSIPYLGQAMYTLAYGRPEVARGKPNSLLAEEARYRQAFDEQVSLETFYWAARLFRAVDSHLQSATSQIRYPERRYLLPIVSYAVAVRALHAAPQHWSALLPLVKENRVFSEADLENAAFTVQQCLNEFTGKNHTTPAEATKRQPLTQYVTQRILSGH